MAITGTINGGYAGYAGRYAVRIYYEYTQDINNNSSTVSAWFQIRSVSSAEYGAWSNLGSSSLSFGGYSASGGVTFDFRDYNWHTVRSLENKVITHNNDGTKTISFSASFATNDPDISSITTAWASGDVTLNTIPRASKFGTVSNFVIENSFSFPITKYNTGVDDTLKIQYSTWSKTITPYVSGQSITLSTAEKNALYALLPNETSATFNLTITTGSIGSNTATCKGTITEQKPSFSPTITISPMTAISGITTVTVTLSSGATAYKSGTISEYVVSLGSQTLRSNSYSTSFIFQNCNGATVTAQAVDSRGWISDPTTKNLTQLYPYSAPVINGSVTRAPNMAGTSATLTLNGTFSVVPNQTNPAVSYRYRQSGGAWSASTSVTATYGTGTFSYSATLVETFNVAYVYEFEITATDAYKTSTKTFTLYSAQPTVDMDTDTQRIGVGGFLGNEDNKSIVGYGDIYEQGAKLATRYQSNRNLLDNAYFIGGGSQNGYGVFPINQRGQGSYTSTYAYAIDRWKTAQLNSVTVNANALRFTINTTNNARCFCQAIPKTMLLGKTVTISALISANTTTQGVYIQLFNGNNSTNLATWIGSNISTKGTGLISRTIDIPSSLSYDFVIFVIGFVNDSSGATNTGYADFNAVKMEFGSTQTLAHQENGSWVLNEIPDFQQELQKCQAYFQAVGSSDNWKFYPVVVRSTSVIAMMDIPISPMRAKPTVSINQSMGLVEYPGGGNVATLTITSVSEVRYSPYDSFITIQVNASNSLTAGRRLYAYLGTNGAGSIHLSAEP